MLVDYADTVQGRSQSAVQMLRSELMIILAVSAETTRVQLRTARQMVLLQGATALALCVDTATEPFHTAAPPEMHLETIILAVW